MKEKVFVDGKKIAWRESMTVDDLLTELGDRYHYAVIRLNKRYVSRPNFKNTFIPADARIRLIPMIAGG